MTAVQPRATDKRDAAIELARAGFPVFPLVPNGKTPAIENWQNLATTDMTQIMVWWHTRPDANIGIHTANLLVVDIDPEKGGRESFAALAMTEEFPDTAASKTRSGGTHLLYALPPHTTVKNSVEKLGKGLDTRSYGGFVVAAGSTIDGKTYEWLPGCSPEERKPATAPQWLIDKCNSAQRKTRQAGQRIIEEDETALDMAEAYLQHNAPEAIQGGRDHTAYKLAAALYDFGISRATCEALMLEWNEGWCHPSLEAHEIERIVWSASTNRDNAIGSKHPNAPGFEVVEIAPKVAPETYAPAYKRGLYALTYRQATDTALDSASEPLIDGLLDRQAMSVWYGELNSGKTFVMLDAAWHIAAGRPWGGMDTKQGTVVYVAAEGGKGILKRVKALATRYPEAGEVPLHIVPCPVDLLHKDADLKPLVELIKGIPGTVELVVIDTLSRAIAGGNENDSQDMGVFVGHLDAIRTAVGAHVAVVHHTGKDKAKGARGHSLLRAATDTEIEIDNRTVTVTKQRDMEGDVCHGFNLKQVRLGTDRNGKEVTSCTVDLLKEGQRAAPIALQPLLRGVLNDIRAALQKRFEDTKQATVEVFGWQLLADYLSEKVSDKPIPRTTVLGYLSELSKKGYVKNLGRNQWVVANVGNVGNVENFEG